MDEVLEQLAVAFDYGQVTTRRDDRRVVKVIITAEFDPRKEIAQQINLAALERVVELLKKKVDKARRR